MRSKSWNMVRMELTAADPSDAMRRIMEAGIGLYRVSREEDALSLEFWVHRCDLGALSLLAQKRGYALRLVDSPGVDRVTSQIKRRPVLMIGILILLGLSFFLPTRVLFFRVEGNAAVPTRLILDKCEECGISFGASRREVRSERVKNALIDAIPQLQWVGINTTGCTAVISVTERALEEPQNQTGAPVSGIFATRDGVITRCTVSQGSTLCRVGQVVRAGQLLVSGYTDCGICIKTGNAEAEIFAQTQRQLQAIFPMEWKNETPKTAQKKKYALIIGKKRINFYKGSGISGTGCDKMYSQYYLTLPGDFVLPLAIVTETWTQYSVSDWKPAEQEGNKLLSSFASEYLKAQMCSGVILFTREEFASEKNALLLTGNYACEEMIAQVRNEEIWKPNGNNE